MGQSSRTCIPSHPITNHLRQLVHHGTSFQLLRRSIVLAWHASNAVHNIQKTCICRVRAKCRLRTLRNPSHFCLGPHTHPGRDGCYTRCCCEATQLLSLSIVMHPSEVFISKLWPAHHNIQNYRRNALLLGFFSHLIRICCSPLRRWHKLHFRGRRFLGRWLRLGQHAPCRE